jgi:hypothetical protein
MTIRLSRYPGLAQVPSMHAAGSHGFGKLQILKQVADNGVSYGAWPVYRRARWRRLIYPMMYR